MVYYAILESDDGFSIFEVTESQKPEEVALSQGGVVIDPGPYSTYDEAVDALDQLAIEDDGMDVY